MSALAASLSLAALLLLPGAHGQCVLPSALADYGPVLAAFSASNLPFIKGAGSTPQALTLGGVGASAQVLFNHPTRTSAYAVECGVSLDLNFVTSMAAIETAGPGVGASRTRCTLLAVNSIGGVSYANFSTYTTSPAACTVPATAAAFAAAASTARTASMRLGAPGSSLTFEPPCSSVRAPDASSTAALAGVIFLGSAGGLSVNVSNATLLMPEAPAAFAPFGDTKSTAADSEFTEYSILTCIKAAAVLSNGAVAVQSFADTCVYLKPYYTAGFLTATTTWVPCATLTALPAADSPTKRFTGTFANAPAPGSPGGQSLPPPPSPTKLTQQSVPVVSFSNKLSFPGMPTGVADVAAKVLTPCSVAALRSGLSASLSVPLASVLLSRITLSDNSFMDLSPTSAGNSASGACAAGAARLLRAANGVEAAEEGMNGEDMGAFLVQGSPATARRLAIAAGEIEVKTTLVSPSPAMLTSLNSGTPLTVTVPTLGGAAPASASTGAAVSNATLSLPVPPIVRIKPYTPSALIKSWNAIPRGSSTNEFSMSNLGPDSIVKCAQALGAKASCPNNYIFGALAPGVALIVCGVVFLIVWLLVYCFACIRCGPKLAIPFCCGRWKPRDRSAGGRYERCAFWLPKVRLALGIVNMALVFAALSYIPLFPKGLTGIDNTASNLINTLSDVASLLKPGTAAVTVRLFDGATTLQLSPPLGAIGSAGTNLKALYQATKASPYQQCDAIPANTCSSSFVINLLSATGDAMDTAGGADMSGAASGVSSATDAMKSGLGSLGLSSVSTMITDNARYLFILIAISCVAQALWWCRCFLACCMYKSLAPISIIWNFILFLLAGIFYIVAILGSDVCINPSTTILSALNGQKDIAYYLTCATDPNIEPPTFLAFISSAISKLASGSAQISKLVTLANGAGTSAAGYGPLVSVVSGSGSSATYGASTGITAAAASITAATESIRAIPESIFSCVQVDALFSSVFDSLCNGTVSSAAGIAQCLVAAAVLMLIQMAIGVDQCCFHPGDKSAWEDNGAADAGKNCCGMGRGVVGPVASKAAAHETAKDSGVSGAAQC